MDSHEMHWSEAHMSCPVCSIDLYISDMFLHLLYYHPEFIVVMTSITDPYVAPVEREDEDYEYFSSLCETLGNHKVGVKDIDYSAPRADADAVAAAAREDSRCVICLENLCDAEFIRQVRGCDHGYCGPCIETWLHENKTCPICKKYLE